MRAAGGKCEISCFSGNLYGAFIPTAAGTREVVNSASDDVLQPVLGLGDFPLQSLLVQVSQIGVGQRVAAHVEPRVAQFAHLSRSEVATPSQKSERDVESRAEASILQDRGVALIPDILANAGGVTVSYFEWVQALQAFSWTEAEVNTRLKYIMDRSFAATHATAERYNTDMRTAALIAAVERVADAVECRGIYP